MKTKKKRSSSKEGKLFSPNSSGDLRSNAHQSQIKGGMQMQTILKLLGGIQSNYWGNISPIPWMQMQTILKLMGGCRCRLYSNYWGNISPIPPPPPGIHGMQMQTILKLMGGCRCRLYSNYWGGYSQIIGGIYLPSPLASLSVRRWNKGRQM